jgi:hypothetical protein
MKLIIAGSRTINLPELLLNDLMCNIVGRGWETVHELVHGGCPSGPDKACADLIKYYEEDSCDIPHKVFLADWETQGKAAGPIRNKEMAEYADALLLIWDGESRGSANMKANMLKLGKPVYEVILKKHNV